MQRKVLILYTSIGLGHKTMAENIGWQLEQAGFVVRLADILEVQTGSLVNVSTKIHSFINRKLPFLWSWLYWITNHETLTAHLRVSLAKNHSDKTKKLIDDFQPDLVISTQTTGSAVMSYLKQSGQYKNKFAIAFSDFHLHRYWVYDQADFYLVNIVEQKTEMVRLGVSPEKIFVVGMTLKDKPNVDALAVKQKLGIPIPNKVVLMGSGSLGIGSTKNSLLETISFIRKAVSENTSLTFIIVCGKNKELFENLKSVNDENILPLSFYSPMSELYAISSIFITKPGGMSVSESLQANLPLVVTHWLPGQEELNYKYLSNKKLIIPAAHLTSPDRLGQLVAAELATQDFRNSLLHNPAVIELVGRNKKPNRLISAIELGFHGV
jgi:UDP-N-acetylglucosamine:LPS N-acetylglucosamine transferase